MTLRRPVASAATDARLPERSIAADLAPSLQSLAFLSAEAARCSKAEAAQSRSPRKTAE